MVRPRHDTFHLELLVLRILYNSVSVLDKCIFVYVELSFEIVWFALVKLCLSEGIAWIVHV